MRKGYACLDFVNGPAPRHRRAKELRRAMRAVLSAHARAAAVPEDARRALDAAVSRAYRRPKLARDRGRYRLRWDSHDDPLHAIVRSTVRLLTSEDADRLRICAAEDCDWLFVDRSRNRSRRWCDMTTCGNRAKARRFYARWT